MRISEIFRAIFLNMAANKMRVFLTALGIIIGSLTIIIVVGIGKGSEQAVANQFKRLSVESITLRKNRDYKGSKVLSEADIPNLEALSDVKSAGVSQTSQTSISYDVTTQTAPINGISTSMIGIDNLEIAYGDFFTDDDGEKRNKVVVLGDTLAQSFFGDNVSTAIGEDVTIKGRKYKVVGVLKSTGDSSGMGADSSAYIPIKVAQSYLAGRGGMGENFVVQAKDVSSVSAAVSEVNEYTSDLTGDDEAYSAMDAGSRLASAQESAKTMSTLLIAVAAIVLIVGGIGIMNVLLVSVRERTKEIGILKSIGAKRSVILAEFLFEAIMISLIGGLIGAALSFAATPIIGMMDVTVLPSVEGISLGLLFSIITGTFFGFYPAFKASKLKPIEALSYEN